MKSHMEPNRSVKKDERHVRVIQQKHDLLSIYIVLQKKIMA
jgi:hypothetical protein